VNDFGALIHEKARVLVNVMIRLCKTDEFEIMWEIVNDAAKVYRRVIPADRWKEPYMPREELQHEIDDGVVFWGYEEDGKLIGLMGIQPVQDVTLIRHAYVLTARKNQGIGSTLLASLREKTLHPVLVGTWAAAFWAVRFYEKHGFRLVTPEEKDRLLKKYWSIPERQVETSVVLADRNWFAREGKGEGLLKERRHEIPIVSIVGRSNTGKTTLIEKMIPELSRKGYRVATVKHTIHGFDIDREGKDSWRHRKAGARVTVIASPGKVALLEDVDGDYEIEELRDKYITGVDIILVEGFKKNPFPKIEVVRSGLKQEPLSAKEDNLIAVVCDHPVERGVPRLKTSDVESLVTLVEERFLKGSVSSAD
jgi:molybdopterin-guanine dinucleotide biosynthesis protein MobB